MSVLRSSCWACGREVIWTHDSDGRSVVLDPKTSVSHLTTCPEKAAWQNGNGHGAPSSTASPGPNGPDDHHDHGAPKAADSPEPHGP